jgi:hypothetical protein
MEALASDTPGQADILKMNKDALLALGERFNLLSLLRTYPVGIPSLMVSRSPLEIPGGFPAVINIASPAAAFGLWLVLGLIGLTAGTLYFALIAQAVLYDGFDWRFSLASWPWASLQVVFLALFFIALFLGISIPFSCMLTLMLMSGLGQGQLPMLLLGGIFGWLLLPLVFSPHGIFVHRKTMWSSLWDSIRITRMTLPATGLFLLLALVISEGFDMLWVVPAENSWWTIVGVFGHAFITSGLLAASFAYYNDAHRWVQALLQKARRPR